MDAQTAQAAVLSAQPAAECKHPNKEWSPIVIATYPETYTFKCKDCGIVGHRTNGKDTFDCFCLHRK